VSACSCDALTACLCVYALIYPQAPRRLCPRGDLPMAALPCCRRRFCQRQLQRRRRRRRQPHLNPSQGPRPAAVGVPLLHVRYHRVCPSATAAVARPRRHRLCLRGAAAAAANARRHRHESFRHGRRRQGSGPSQPRCQDRSHVATVQAQGTAVELWRACGRRRVDALWCGREERERAREREKRERAREREFERAREERAAPAGRGDAAGRVIIKSGPAR
jgi:hypothetical protein